MVRFCCGQSSTLEELEYSDNSVCHVGHGNCYQVQELHTAYGLRKDLSLPVRACQLILCHHTHMNSNTRCSQACSVQYQHSVAK